MPGLYPDIIKKLPLYDGRFDAYKLEAKGSDVLFASYPAGTSIPSHSHDTDNHGVITRGELLLTVNGSIQRVRVGEWYHVPANVEHSAVFEVETDEIEFWFQSSASPRVSVSAAIPTQQATTQATSQATTQATTQALGAGDRHELSARLIMAEKRKQTPGLSKRDIYKWLAIFSISVILLILIF